MPPQVSDRHRRRPTIRPTPNHRATEASPGPRRGRARGRPRPPLGCPRRPGGGRPARAGRRFGRVGSRPAAPYASMAGALAAIRLGPRGWPAPCWARVGGFPARRDRVRAPRARRRGTRSTPSYGPVGVHAVRDAPLVLARGPADGGAHRGGLSRGGPRRTARPRRRKRYHCSFGLGPGPPAPAARGAALRIVATETPAARRGSWSFPAPPVSSWRRCSSRRLARSPGSPHPLVAAFRPGGRPRA